MAEQLELTDPVVVPEKVTNTYRVVVLTTDRVSVSLPTTVPGFVLIVVEDNHGVRRSFTYTGDVAIDMIQWMNTANFSVNSMHKRILQKLSADGYLPGTVTGSPDPPTRTDL
jgi:hypothetical protein